MEKCRQVLPIHRFLPLSRRKGKPTVRPLDIRARIPKGPKGIWREALFCISESPARLHRLIGKTRDHVDTLLLGRVRNSLRDEKGKWFERVRVPDLLMGGIRNRRIAAFVRIEGVKIGQFPD